MFLFFQEFSSGTFSLWKMIMCYSTFSFINKRLNYSKANKNRTYIFSIKKLCGTSLGAQVKISIISNTKLRKILKLKPPCRCLPMLQQKITKTITAHQRESITSWLSFLKLFFIQTLVNPQLKQIHTQTTKFINMCSITSKKQLGFMLFKVIKY